MAHSRHRVTTDAIIRDGDKIVLIQRASPPFEGQWALPGGHVESGERPKDALKREITEEVGIAVIIEDQLGEHAGLIHDPRGPVIPLTYRCRPESTQLEAATDAEKARWFTINSIPDTLAFGHHTVLEKHVEGYTSNS